MKSIVILAAVCLLTLAQGQIIDYTYVKDLEDTHFDLTKKYDISIAPQPFQNDYLSFPASCDLPGALHATDLIEEDEFSIIDENRHFK